MLLEPCFNPKIIVEAADKRVFKVRSMEKIRVVIAKIGLDGHDRGAKVISRFLRDAGMEVIYTGIRQTPEEISLIAMQEDANLIGISILSGAHITLLPRLIQQLQKNRCDIPVVVGGIIPNDDIDYLKSIGVKEVFGPGSTAEEIVQAIYEIIGYAAD